jgi:hypothetical protein
VEFEPIKGGQVSLSFLLRTILSLMTFSAGENPQKKFRPYAVSRLFAGCRQAMMEGVLIWTDELYKLVKR